MNLRLHAITCLGMVLMSQAVQFLLTPIPLLSLSCQPIESDPPKAEGLVTGVWTGGVTMDQAVASVHLSQLGEARLWLATDSLESSLTPFTEWKQVEASGYGFVKFSLSKLTPATDYWYRLEVNGQLDTSEAARGHFRTFDPRERNFSIAFASCARTGSRSKVFETIAVAKPDLYLNTGDLHYGDIQDSCEAAHAYYLSQVLQSPTQNRLYRSVPIAYMWDDHDFGPNNSSSSNDCRAEAQRAYQRNVPHYPLAVANCMPAMSQSFVMGRVRFVMPDLRSMKQLPYFDGCEKTRLGTNFGTEAHLQWFESELLAAKAAGQAVAWVSSIPFIGTLGENGLWCGDRDAWPSFAEERNRIAAFIRDHEIPIFILSGDAHMLAIDDGSNSSYAVGAPGIPVFQAGALDRTGSHKGGPFSHGAMAAGGQFGWMEVEDDGGDSLLIRWVGKNLHGDTVISSKGILLAHEFQLGVKSNPELNEALLAAARGDQLRIWPNPAEDHLNIELPDAFRDGGSLQLIDVQGRTIFDQNISTSVFQLPLPASLSKGLYWIQAQPSHGKTVYERVLVD